MVHVATSSSTHDAFTRVSEALLTVWPAVRDPAAGLSATERCLLLDECGSDYRPLVTLLLDIGKEVRPVLVAFGGSAQEARAWANTRAPLVHRLVATRYLQPDVARWAVDVWGRALGVAPPPEPPVVVTVVATHAAPESTPASPASPAARATRAPTPARRPTVVSPAQVPATLRNLPSWAGGPISPRVGGSPSALATRGRLVVQGTAPVGPRYQPVERRAAIVFVVLLLSITVALSQALRERRADTAPATTEQRVPDKAELFAPVVPDTALPAPLVVADSALVASLQPAPSDSSSAMVLQPEPSNSTSARVPVIDWAADHAAGPPGDAGSVLDAGIGGRYLVAQRVRDVSGTSSCDAVAQAHAAGRESTEIVEHQPGTSTFVLTSRQVTGTLASDGWFSSHPRSGTTNNVNWQFRMRGRFGRDGFSAVSETYTEAILRWGRTQYCVVTADLTGRRLPG